MRFNAKPKFAYARPYFGFVLIACLYFSIALGHSPVRVKLNPSSVSSSADCSPPGDFWIALVRAFKSCPHCPQKLFVFGLAAAHFGQDWAPSLANSFSGSIKD